MATLLMQLVGPMQSWGTTSRFDRRDTGKEPSKSGVIGLVAAAMGIERRNWVDLEPLTKLTMGVRHDRPGIPKSDYQTAGCESHDSMMKADGKLSNDGVVSRRDYLADAAFLVGLEGEDYDLLKRSHYALSNPVWPLALGRKSYVPLEPIWIKEGLQDIPLFGALSTFPWLSSPRYWERPPHELLISIESSNGEGLLKMDQPLSSFAERRFGARYVLSTLITLPKEVAHVSEQNTP